MTYCASSPQRHQPAYKLPQIPSTRAQDLSPRDKLSTTGRLAAPDRHRGTLMPRGESNRSMRRRYIIVQHSSNVFTGAYLFRTDEMHARDRFIRDVADDDGILIIIVAG